MDFVNETNVEAGWTLGFEPDGRELLVVAIKATFSIPENGDEAALAKTQAPLTEADEFTGEPGFSAPLYETDYAHRKPYCDVLLNGSAYAPQDQVVKFVTVGMQVGSLKKSIKIIGDRFLYKGLASISVSPPKEFTRLPITYDRAYGGVDADKENPEKVETNLKNPVGVGYYPISKGKALEGKFLPNTEEINHPVKKIKGDYKPMSFGPIGRNFASRVPFAGTYDQQWLDNQAPFWPDDFDYRYFQAAPADQQIPYPKGGEAILLKNLTAQGLTRFKIPNLPMPVNFIPYRGKYKKLYAVIDTILIEPDLNRFMLTWRISYPLRKNCFELMQVVAGEMPRSWHIAQQYGEKPYYKNLAEFINTKKQKTEI